MAMESDKVRADMVEATEFPDLSNKYQVMGVPRTIINEEFILDGSVPEQQVLAKIREVIGA